MAGAGVVLLGSESGTVTLYANEAAAVSVGESLVFLGLSGGRASPWEIIGYPGADAIRAKFMGAKPRTYSIFGAVLATDEAGQKSGLDTVMGMNKAKEYWTITAGGIVIHDGTGMICEEVVSSLVGMGTGPIWNFEIRMRDLGTT